MIIDLSLPIKNNTSEPDSPVINYLSHGQGAEYLAKAAASAFVEKNPIKWVIVKFMQFAKKISGDKIKVPLLSKKDFPDEMGLAIEELVLDTHAGTHLDAPWHFGPKAGDKEALTIDEVPLEWCYSDGVVLDLSDKESGESIAEEDIKNALSKINYEFKPFDIVLIMTGADKSFNDENYFWAHPGMSREATKYILSKGVKIIGIDGWGFDRPAMKMLKDYLKTRDKSYIFPAHFTGRELEYCHIEKLANLDKIPQPYGFKVSCFPVKIENAGAGWCRVVAIL